MNTKPYVSLVSSIVLLFICAGVYGLFYSMVNAESAKASTLEAEITQQNNASTQTAQAKSELDRLSSQSATINQYFVETNNVVPFLEQLQSLGNYLGSNVQVVSVSAVPGSPYGQLNLSLTVTGSFDAVARTIGSIEYEPYDTAITSLTLNTSTNPNTTASSAPQWTATATFTVGAQTQGNAPITAAPQAAPTTNAPNISATPPPSSANSGPTIAP